MGRAPARGPRGARSHPSGPGGLRGGGRRGPSRRGRTAARRRRPRAGSWSWVARWGSTTTCRGWPPSATSCAARSSSACPCSGCAWVPSSWPPRSVPTSRSGPRRRSARVTSSSPPRDGRTRYSVRSTAGCRAPPSRASTGTATHSHCPRAPCTWPPPGASPTRPSGSDPAPTASSSTSRSTPHWPTAGARSCPTASPWARTTWPGWQPWAGGSCDGSSARPTAAVPA